jgi:hypothetical protein
MSIKHSPREWNQLSPMADEKFVQNRDLEASEARRDVLLVGCVTILVRVPVSLAFGRFGELEERHLKAEDGVEDHRSETFCEVIGIGGCRKGPDTQCRGFCEEQRSNEKLRRDGHSNVAFSE